MEYELAFFEFDYKDIQKKLKKLGGKKKHKFALYNIAYFFLAGQKDFSKGFVRIRDENGMITLTTKLLNKTKYAEEFETHVDTTFNKMKLLLEASGLECKLNSMKYREKWSVPGAHEIVFDIWPGLPISLEVDCDNEDKLHKICDKLDLDIQEGFKGGTQYNKLYEITNEIMKKLPDVNFSNFKKILKPYVKNNMKTFNSINKKYYEQFIDFN